MLSRVGDTGTDRELRGLPAARGAAGGAPAGPLGRKWRPAGPRRSSNVTQRTRSANVRGAMKMKAEIL